MIVELHLKGKIEVANDVDYFKVVVPENKKALLYTTGGLDTIGTLLYADNRLYAQNDDSEGTNFKIEDIPTGTYYLEVSAYENNIGDYTLHFETVDLNTEDTTAPSFSANFTTDFVVDENITTNIIFIDSSIIDDSKPLSYSIHGGDSDDFTHEYSDVWSGEEFHFKTVPVYADKSFYSFTLRVSDAKGNYADKEISITVRNSQATIPGLYTGTFTATTVGNNKCLEAGYTNTLSINIAEDGSALATLNIYDMTLEDGGLRVSIQNITDDGSDNNLGWYGAILNDTIEGSYTDLEDSCAGTFSVSNSRVFK